VGTPTIEKFKLLLQTNVIKKIPVTLETCNDTGFVMTED
jgi:hypothetical protein